MPATPECGSTALKTPFLTPFQRDLDPAMAVSEWWGAEIALLAGPDQPLQKTNISWETRSSPAVELKRVHLSRKRNTGASNFRRRLRTAETLGESDNLVSACSASVSYSTNRAVGSRMSLGVTNLVCVRQVSMARKIGRLHNLG
jgi:hypothetical protein